MLLSTPASSPTRAQCGEGAREAAALEQRRLGRQALREARSAAGLIPLLQLWRAQESTSPALTITELERLIAGRAVPAPRRAYASALLARAQLRAGETDAARATIEGLGYVTAWQIIGPFDNEGKTGFDRELPPEMTRLEPPDGGARYRGRERMVGWRAYPDVSHFGYVNFDAVYRPYAHVCAYAQTTVSSERAQPLSLWVGAGGAVKVWWNGEEVHRDASYRQPGQDRDVAMVGARAGANRLLVKSCVASSTWGFFLRIGDRDGAPASGVRVEPSSLEAVEPGHGLRRLPRAPRSERLAFEEAAAAARPRAAALENLARFLAYTGADDISERRALQLATRAVELEPTLARVRLAASLSEHRSELMRFVEEALAMAPDDPEALLLAAEARAGSVDPTSALPILSRIPEGGLAAIGAAALRADLYDEMGLVEAALAEVLRGLESSPQASARIGRASASARAAGRFDQAVALDRRLVEVRYDAIDARRRLVGDALRRDERSTVISELEVIHALGRDSGQNLRYLAGIYEAMGESPRALALLREAVSLTPQDPDNKVAMGRLLLRLEQPDAAIEALEAALRLRPQDAATRELLEQIRPRERVDERYAIDAQTILSRRREASGYPITTLQSLTVNTVFENGLGSAFHQLVVQVHDEEGARRWRTRQLQYDPGSQRLDVRLARVYRADGRVLEATQTFEQQLGEPWYRIYYDTRALVILFPDLEPGDTVELRWRVDDVAHRNLFADYYGDLHFLQDFTPTVASDYYLITPSERRFHFNEPSLEGLEHRSAVEGAHRVDHFSAVDVPALLSEEGMPGMTEVAPYLHVSTYATWREVGRWWWGLVQDQLYADESLQRTVRELVAGAPDLETKVRRIHDWVLENTRYVGLEFGIHGYKPYRVPQIVRRGFGDCKDKASLLFTMFREAGIDAHLVLVRTRPNGAITDLPASLAVFDHAIAYVPSLDLYIDGTAEHSGLRELPEMDQGVTVLHVWATGAELRETPVLPPASNRRERVMEVRLEPDGGANIEVEELVIGAMAPGYRSRYRAEGTRRTRLEQSLRATFPGLRLEEQRFGPLDDLEVPIRYQYEAFVPRMAQRDGARLQVAPSVLGDLLRTMARSPERAHILDLGGTSSYQERRVVHIPRGMRLVETPREGSLDGRFASLRLEVEADAREVTMTVNFELRKDRVRPEEYEAYRRWVESADQLLRQRLIFEEAP